MTEAEAKVIEAARERAKRRLRNDPEGRTVLTPTAKTLAEQVKKGPASLTLEEVAAIEDDPALRVHAKRMEATVAPAEELDEAVHDGFAVAKAVEMVRTRAKALAVGTEIPPNPHGRVQHPGVTLEEGVEGLVLMELAISTEVVARVPKGVSDKFATIPSVLFCFSVFKNRAGPKTVIHVWRRNGRTVSRVELNVGKSPQWRTWSRQRLDVTWAGDWSCEVLAPEGASLGQANFVLGP